MKKHGLSIRSTGFNDWQVKCVCGWTNYVADQMEGIRQFGDHVRSQTEDKMQFVITYTGVEGKSYHSELGKFTRDRGAARIYSSFNEALVDIMINRGIWFQRADYSGTHAIEFVRRIPNPQFELTGEKL